MAITLLAQYAAAVGDITFIEKVEVAMIATAQNMNAEASGTVDHANRMALMKAATNNPSQYAPLFAFVVAAQGIDGTSSDAAIQAMVATCWDTLAGQP